jgi:bacterioferritin-associated ferredoxin
MLKQNPELRKECSSQCGKCRNTVREFFANNHAKVNSIHSK